MNGLPGVATYCSCQGIADYGPNIEFFADLDAAQQVYKLLGNNGKRYWNNVIVGLTGKRGDKNSWHAWFYDTLALIEFTKDYLGVAVDEQVKSFVPERAGKVLFADVEEIEKIISLK